MPIRAGGFCVVRGRYDERDSDDRDRRGGAGLPLHRRRWPATFEQRWQQHWEEHGTFHAPNPVGELSGDAAAARRQDVRAGHVPVPVGRGPARRPPAGLHRHRRVRPVPPDERPQRAAHHGFRRVRPAGRAVRRAAPASTRARPPRTTSPPTCGRSAGWGWATTSAAGSPPSTPSYYRWTQWIFLRIYNSWYDEQAGRARPIAELEAEYANGPRRWATLSAETSVRQKRSTRSGWPTCRRRR